MHDWYTNPPSIIKIRERSTMLKANDSKWKTLMLYMLNIEPPNFNKKPGVWTCNNEYQNIQNPRKFYHKSKFQNNQTSK